jgi:hypothetical protein
MAGRLRSSRMNENVLEEGLRKGMIEMNEGMKRVLGKLESSNDVPQGALKSTVMRGFEGMAMVLEKVVKGIGERLAENVRTKDRGERELKERIKWLEDRVCEHRRVRGAEERERERRMQGLEQRLEEREEEDRCREECLQAMEQKLKEGEEEEKKRVEALQTKVTALVGRVGELAKFNESAEEREKQQEEERIEKERVSKERMNVLEEGLKELEMAMKGMEVSAVGNDRRGQVVESGRREEEKERMGEDRAQKESSIQEKVRILEEGLEKEKKVREMWEKERKKEVRMRERMESIKEMERKVSDSMETLKFLNLRFKKVSEDKGELLKEAEGIIKGRVRVKDRSEYEGILRRSKVYILGKGTKEKVVNGERLCTAPVLVKCGSQIERQRLEKMVKSSGVRTAFHWPKEMVEFVCDIRGKVERMGYRKEEYFIKVRPFKVDGIPQLRAEVKKMNGRVGSFKRIACWPCPPAAHIGWSEKN